MRPFFIIRPYEVADSAARQKLMRSYIMSFASDAFTECLFREVFFQAIFLLIGVLFIFVHLPLIGCVSSIPFLIIALYVSLHATYFLKAQESSIDPVASCWVAETYVPLLMETVMDYDLMHDSHLRNINMNQWKRKIIGTITLADHNELDKSGWITQFAVKDTFCDTREGFEKIAMPLIERALSYSAHRRHTITETVTTECQMDMREMMMKLGFDFKQTYHRYVLFNFSQFRYMKTQLGINVSKWKLLKDC